MNAAIATAPDSRRLETLFTQIVLPDAQADVPDSALARAEAERAYRAVEIVDRVNKNYFRAVSYRQPWIEDRTLAYDYKEQRQWPTAAANRNRRKVQITVNKILPALNRIMAFISKTKMSVGIEGVGPEDAIKGKIFHRLFEDVTRKDASEFKIHESLKDSRTCGLGILKEVWNWELDFPFGRPELLLLRSDEVLVEPGASGLQFEDADWIIHEQRMTVEKARALYPEYKDQIRPDMEWLRNSDRPQWFSTYSEFNLRENRRDGAIALPTDQTHPELTTIKEMWYKEYHRVVRKFSLRNITAIIPGESPQTFSASAGKEIPDDVVDSLGLLEDQDFVGIPFVLTEIRAATVINDTLCSDRPSPYAHDKFPFIFFKANCLDKYSYPSGDVIFGVEIQDVINKLHSINVDQMVRSNYSPLIGERGSIDETTTRMLEKYGITNSQLLLLKRGTKLDRLPPPQGVQEGFLILLRELSASFDELMGYFPIDRAQTQYPTSGKGMEELRLSSDVFHSPKANPIQHGLLWWTDMRVSNMQYLMKQEIMVRIDDRLKKLLEGTPHNAFMSSDTTGASSYTLNKQGLDENMQPITLNDLSVGKYDIKATIAADYAATQRDKAEMALGLKARDVYDDQAVLDALDDPNTDEILRRKAEKNSLLQLGQRVAEDPVMMAVMQNPDIRARIEEMLKGTMLGSGGAPPVP